VALLAAAHRRHHTPAGQEETGGWAPERRGDEEKKPMSSYFRKIFHQAIRCNRQVIIIKNTRNWVVISWICGEDQLAQGEGSKLIHLPNLHGRVSPIRNPGEVNLKTDVHVTYDMQSWRCWTCCEIRRLSFQWHWSHIQLKYELTGI
jgi:hypothetical protein